MAAQRPRDCSGHRSMNPAALWYRVVRRGAAERELDAELRAHVELLTDERVAAGMSPAAARRAALLEVGGVETVKDHVRDAWTGAALQTLIRDLRYGAR